MPWDSAEEKDSMSASSTRTSVSRECPAYASICSPSRAQPTMRSTTSESSAVNAGSRGAADGDARDPQRRLPGRDRHRLPVLAARAGPRVEVVADSVDGLQDLGTVADEVGGAHGLGDLAVLDHVCLGHAEDEIARGGVHGPAPALHAVDAIGSAL